MTPREQPDAWTPCAGSAAEILALLREWDAADDPAPLAVETSGSTGRPKRVLLSRAAMRASADATHARLGGPGQWLLNLPPAYVAGAPGALPLGAGRHRAGGPGRLLRGRGRGDDRRAALRLAGADPAACGSLDEPERAARLRHRAGRRRPARARPCAPRAARPGVRVVATYGMSETCGGCVYDGRPLDGVARQDRRRRRASGSADRSSSTGTTGSPELTAQATERRLVRTQDLGRIDHDGLLRVTGRVDDVVISGGVNVPAGAVAGPAARAPLRHEAEVVGVPDPEWGQRGRRRAGRGPVARRCPGLGRRRRCRARGRRVASYPVDALPLLPNGKVDRLGCREARRRRLRYVFSIPMTHPLPRDHRARGDAAARRRGLGGVQPVPGVRLAGSPSPGCARPARPPTSAGRRRCGTASRST